MVRTVTGSINTDELGFTLMHEHLYLGNWNNRMLIERGVTKEQINTIFIDNPKKIFG